MNRDESGHDLSHVWDSLLATPRKSHEMRACPANALTGISPDEADRCAAKLLACRLITCKAIPSPLRRRLLHTLNDRCRIPSLYGGAMKVRIDTIIPIIFIPFSLIFATLHFYVTLFTLTVMPILMMCYYRHWRRRHDKQRTKMFLSWAMTSIVFMLVVFEVFVMPFRKLLLWEHVLLLSSTFVLFYLMKIVKRDPGVAIPPSKEMVAIRTKENCDHDIQNGSLVNCGDDEHIEIRMGNAHIPLAESSVTWIDSRPIVDGYLATRCERCDMPRPPRSGHCKLCDVCIHGRDHHCVWLDVCIGSHNHRPFLATLVLFILCSLYGAHLSLTTICVPEMYLDWFLLPSHCEFVYSDFPNAICFVSICYTLLSAMFVILALIQQLILISQNLTSQELHQATSRNLTRFYVIAKNNVHNHGFVRNWWLFLNKKSRPVSSVIPY